jgi:ATP/maltotriose-dependent transcriptional regulator MalT
VIADLWAAQGKREAAVELLTLIYQRPTELWGWQRDGVAEKLRQLKAQVSADAFTAAQERGTKLDLDQVIREVLAQSIVTSRPQALADPLNKRELEILRLIAEGLTNGEIADRLVLAISTVKWYVNQIFGKLNTTSRMQAVTHARSLGLLP